MSHLLELRDRLLRITLSVIIIFLCLFYFANDIYTYLAVPLTSILPEGSSMVAIGVASTFLIPFKLTLVLSVFIAVPYILYQVWGFIAPGLYRHERRLAFPVLFSSTILFYTGMLFAYFVVFPLVFKFFAAVVPEDITYTPDIGSYLDTVLTLFFAFGVAFEVPIATVLLVWTGATTPQKLAEKRAYVIVGAFVIGMLLTPPDVVSQTLLAVPMWILFELGILFSRTYKPGKHRDAEVAAGGDDDVTSAAAEDEVDRELDAIEKEMDNLDNNRS